MSRLTLNAMLLQFGFIMTVGLITILVIPFVVSGDSTTPRQERITLPSTPKVLGNQWT